MLQPPRIQGVLGSCRTPEVSGSLLTRAGDWAPSLAPLLPKWQICRYWCSLVPVVVLEDGHTMRWAQGPQEGKANLGIGPAL